VALVGLALGETVDSFSTDQESFRVLVREQLPRLYSLARRLVGDEAEDAVQDCLLKAYQRFHQLQVAARRRHG
jgi:RNA polymerase sigma-70 factor (ECF subfamily)